MSKGTHEDLMRINRGVYQRLYLLQRMGEVASIAERA